MNNNLYVAPKIPNSKANVYLTSQGFSEEEAKSI